MRKEPWLIKTGNILLAILFGITAFNNFKNGNNITLSIVYAIVSLFNVLMFCTETFGKKKDEDDK